MPAQTAYQASTGAVHCFAAVNEWGLYLPTAPVTSSALYLGTCEQYPLVQGIEEWVATYNDIAGTKPFDKQYFGDHKIVIMDLNKFIQANIDTLIDFGIEGYPSRGAFKQLQPGNCFSLWLQFSNFGTAFAVPGLPAGEVYFCCAIPESGYDPTGTRARKTRLIVEADPAYNAATRGFNGYSQSASYFSGLPSVA